MAGELAVLNTDLCGSTAVDSIHPELWRFALAATHMSADFITSRVEINGPRHIWGPIRLSYHSSVCWLWLFGSCHHDSGWACRVIDQALLTDRWSMLVGGAMDLSFSLLSSSLFFSPLLDCSAGAWCIGCFQEVYWMTDTSRRGGRLAGRAIVNRTGIWHGQCTKKYQLAAYNRNITIDFVLWEMCMKNQSILLENHQHHSLLGDLLLDSSLAHASPQMTTL